MKTCGIDLGTTFSTISYYDPHNDRVVTVELVQAADGAREVRSVVYYPAGGGVVVGETAQHAARQYPERVVIGVKRSMGTDWKFDVDGKQLSAPEISAEILKVLVQEAEASLGEKVEELVITVPAYFGDAELSATMRAGELAGVKVLRLLPEPHAAALAFVAETRENINDRDLLVYDLGGGTFDVTLIRTEAVPMPASGAADAPDRVVKLITLCKDGNSCLGGLDWDRALAKLVTEKALAEHGVDVEIDALLLENCEKAKRFLTRTETTSVVAGGCSVEITRDDFEQCTQGLLFQTECLVDQVLKDAVSVFQERARSAGQPDPATVDLAYVKSQVDVMLAGGSTKTPMVEAMLQRVMGRPPLRYGNPHLLVSIGAAYLAHLLKAGFLSKEERVDGPAKPRPQPPGPPSDPSVPGPQPTPGDPAPAPEQKTTSKSVIEIIDSTRESVGVAALRVTGRDHTGANTYDEMHAIILPKGSRYGTRKAQEFAKVQDGMTQIEIGIHRGESNVLEDCTLLKTFTISDLPPNGRAGELIDVTLEYDANGILRASAVDRTSGKSAAVEIASPF